LAPPRRPLEAAVAAMGRDEAARGNWPQRASRRGVSMLLVPTRMDHQILPT
jgi:hypothetical protein